MKRLERFLRQRASSFGYAFAGIGYLLRSQPNAWIHAAATLAVLALGLWLQLALAEWALIVLVCTLVWMAEGFNTALEALVDLASPQVHPLARVAKDVAAAAVLAAALGALGVGLLVLGPPLVEKIIP